jgi:uncharacterized integral membrane protein
MSRRDHDALANAQRTRTGRVWAALIPALIVLILLIVFIAENGQRAEVKFFGATGHISLALALLIAAVTGAVIVLLVGGARILQLRLAAWRHQRQIDRPQSAPVAPADEAQGVEAESNPHQARP